MKNVKILNVPKKIIFSLVGSSADLSTIGKYLIERPHLLVDIASGPCRRIANSESSDYIMAIVCPEATYDTVITIIKNFISE